MADTALVTRTAAMERMGLTGSDPTQLLVFDGLVSHVSARISVWCKRTFALSDYTEYLDGTGSERLWLRAWPVLPLSGGYGVWEDALQQFGAGAKLDEFVFGASTDGDYYRDANGAEQGYGCLIRRAGFWGYGRGWIKVYYSAGYGTDAIPEEIQEAGYRLFALWWPIWKAGLHAQASASLPGGGGSASYRELAIPKDVTELLQPFRREGLY